MQFKRNIGSVNRFLRLTAGAMMIAGGIYFLKNPLIGYGLIAMGGMAILTGSSGHCPLCAHHEIPSDIQP